jgi:hypothetical protein
VVYREKPEMLDTYLALHNTVTKFPEVSACEVFNARLVLSYYEHHLVDDPVGEPLLHEEFLASIESRFDAYFESLGFEQPSEELGNKTPLQYYLQSGVWPTMPANVAAMFGVFLVFYNVPSFGDLAKVAPQTATPIALSRLLPEVPPHALLRMAEAISR